MRQSRFLDQERRLAIERRIKYRGTARISLDVLHFQWNEPRELSEKNLERLKKCFQTEGCRRLELENHIPAIINESQLDDAIEASGISADALLSNLSDDYPELKFPAGFQLDCLHGRHRVQAGRETLPSRDKWWTVDLYLESTNHELKTTLIEEYSNEEKPSDGEIYRKIRQYKSERNLCFERRWWARLSDHGRRSLRQLFRHDELTAAFDDLLDITGLWDGMRISTVHKVVGMKCDEVDLPPTWGIDLADTQQEILHYLDHVKKVWSKVLGENEQAMRKVDQATVKALESKAPRSSKLDAQAVRGPLLSGRIFSAFSQQDREAIWHRLCSIDSLIPSLFTFFEDVKYLQATADCVKQLIKLSPRDTVFTALDNCFSNASQTDNQCIVQETDSTFAFKPGTSGDYFDRYYRQIWLAAMRKYPKVPIKRKKKKKDLLAKVRGGEADETVLCEIAALAYRFGFESDEICALKQRSPDREIARSALLKARHPDRYEYDDTLFESYMSQIVEMFSTATPSRSEQLTPALVSDDPDASGNRCGFPDEQAQEEDSKLLFISNLHDTSEEQGEAITSFFVRRSVYFAFFGKSTDLLMNVRSTAQQSGYSSQSSGLVRVPVGNAAMEGVVEEVEQERSEREMREQERREQERRARLEQERLGRERLEREQRERLEQERLTRLEQERLAKLEQRRLEQERLEQGRLEQERHEQERLAMIEQERLERERLEREQLERLEQERLARLEQERLARVEQERLEQERLEQERLEQERLEQERLAMIEQERLKQEMLARLEQERLEQERLERERLARLEQERLEQERLKQERLEQERLAMVEQEKLEQERLEQERLARIEQEKVEQERLAKLEQERLEQENLARLEQDRLEQERLEQEQRQKRNTQIDLERLIEEGLQEQRWLEQERLEQERLEQEVLIRLEQERLEQERLEQERLEQERLAQERLEQERLEQERLDKERLEQERLEQERLEQERLEQERLAMIEQERLQQERLEQERLEQERLTKLEQEQLEQERLENERLENERLENERLEKERLDKERLEKKRLEKERVERERLKQERLEQGKLDQERLARLEKGHLESGGDTSGTQDNAQERAEKRRTQIDFGELDIPRDVLVIRDQVQGQTIGDQALPGNTTTDNAGSVDQQVRQEQGQASEQQGTPTLPRGGPNVEKIRINYKIRERDVWRTANSLLVDPSDPSEVERVAKKYMRKQIRLFDTALNILTPRECFEAAIADGTNTILLISEREISIDEELEASVFELASNTEEKLGAPAAELASDTDAEPDHKRGRS